MSEKNIDTRNERVNNRDSKLEIVLADGTKLTRRPTEQLGRREGKLAIPEKQGFERRWVSDEKPSNLQYYIDLGYNNATDKSGKPYEPITGGVRKNGTEYKLYPLEISKKEIERLREKNRELSQEAKELAQQEKWLNNQYNGELGTYIPEDLQNSNSPLGKTKEIDVRSPFNN